MTERMRTPGGMADLKRLTDRVAGDLDAMASAFHRATVDTPEQAAVVTVAMGRTSRLTGRPPRLSTIVGTGESAMSAAQDALREAAEAMRTVYAELKKAGVPEGAVW